MDFFGGDISPKTDHRDWPLPSEPWLLFQRWHHALFLHWQVKASQLREALPEKLRPYLDFHNGVAWLGIVPFMLRDQRARALPMLPGVSEFSEVNVRTYILYKDRPGVYFFSLDAANPLAVLGARVGLDMPYCSAEMRLLETPEEFRMISRRLQPPKATLDVRYRPSGPAFYGERGSLAHWFAERYCFYNVNANGELYRVENHHEPWELRDAKVEVTQNTMAHALGFELGTPPLAHYSRGVDVVFWRPEFL